MNRNVRISGKRDDRKREGAGEGAGKRRKEKEKERDQRISEMGNKGETSETKNKIKQIKKDTRI